MALKEQLTKESEGEGAEQCLATGWMPGGCAGVFILDQMGALVHP